MARNITVTFSDGTSHVYQNAPDNVTPDQAQARAEKEFSKTVTALDGGRGASTPEAAPAAPQRGLGEELGRQVGLTARAGIKGAVALPAMAADAVSGVVNTGLDAALGRGKGFRFQPTTQALDELMTQAGVATPENARERVVQDVAGSMAGAGGGVAAGKLLAQSAAPATNAIGRLLSAAPGAQTAAAATSGAASGITRESDGGAAAQLAAGMAGAMIPSAAMAGAASRGNKLAQAASENAADLSRNAPKYNTLKESLDAGYVVPPSSVKPTLANTVKESISGKIATAQVASSKNQAVTDSLVRKALGIADDAPLSSEVLSKYRADQHAAGYEPLRNLGGIQTDAKFGQDLADITKKYTGKGTIPAIQKTEIDELVQAHRAAGFDAGDAVDAIRVLRDNAKDAFRKGDSALGKANRDLASAYETMFDRVLPNGALLDDYKAARANIAKSFTVEDALREGAGTVDARKLAAQLQKGAPLSGELKTIAKFASNFPKAAQPPEMVAGPAVHNLKAGLAAGSSALGAMVAGPLGAAAGAAYPFVIPPAVRAQMFSKSGQAALLPKAINPNSGQTLRAMGRDPLAGLPAAEANAIMQLINRRNDRPGKR